MNLINYTTTIDLKHHFYAFKKITIFMLWGSEQYFWSEGVSLKTLFFQKNQQEYSTGRQNQFQKQNLDLLITQYVT